MNKPVRPPVAPKVTSREELEALLLALGPPSDVDNLSDEELEARADADIAAGRFISGERVREWIEALRHDITTPPPEPDVCEL